MGGLSLQQWIRLAGAAPQIIAEVKAALPVIMPLVKQIIALVEELGLDEPTPPEHVVEPQELIEQPRTITADEKALFDRVGAPE